ncbi:MAG: TlpA disulfide reductase family protein [Bacteroidales bacterium]|jgi:thiol-disulfide isomerase/thioredoxin|nr:TlpA disulfide reductase family protein [Bacteroidales bacterium]MDD4176657.1 TlpA disulfide reductase family protein [Bacteroidales bacterium]MDY0333614.1 TlpA disulfide reductase family protein [Bacteroidales bacterium]NCU34794.1 TlpA family protein disulfide reductase [Candidatus Falkowbacteria bacterium]
MPKVILISIILLAAGAAHTQPYTQVPVYDFESLQPLLQKQNDTTYVINFWATWCKPCVAELPAFEELSSKYQSQKVKVLLVSLDFIKNYHTRLLPFINDNKIQPEVVLLNDPRSNQWIDRVSPQWSGAIPATLIYRNTQRMFYERSFTLEELEEEVQKFIKF